MSTDIEEQPQLERPVAITQTRLVAAAVYLHDRTRAIIIDWFEFNPFWAWAPSYGMDLIAVTRHARHARRLATTRDAVLAALLVGTLALVSASLLRRHGVLGWLVVFGSVVAGAIVLRFGRRRLLVWLKGWPERLKKDARQGVGEIAVAVAGLAVLGWFVSRDPDAVTYGYVALGLVVLGFLVVVAHEYWTDRRARAAWTGRRPVRETAPAGPAAFEQRLLELDDANVLTYDHDFRSADTFVGSGQLHYEWSVTMDMRKGVPDKKGVPQATKPVDVLEIHDWLEHAIRDAEIPGMQCGYRVYLDGKGLFRRDKNLLVDSLGPPKTRMSSGGVTDLLLKPGSRTRTYLCAQMSSSDEQVVATAFVRGELISRDLYVQVKVFVLPSVLLPAGVRGLPMTPLRVLAEPPARAVRRSVPLLFGSIRAMWALPRRRLDRFRGKSRERRLIRHYPMYNFGAVESLREWLAVGEHYHSNAWDDTLKAFAIIDQNLIRALDEYLTSKGIDASKLRDDAQHIINNNQTVVHRMSAKNVSFGRKSRAGDSPAHKPQVPSNQPPPASAGPAPAASPNPAT